MQSSQGNDRLHTTNIFLLVLSVLLIASMVVVGVLSYSMMNGLQTANDALQSEYDDLDSRYSDLLLNYSLLLQNYTKAQSQHVDTYRVEVAHYNITWRANSSNSYTLRKANALNQIFNVSGYKTMTVFVDVTRMSNQGQSYDTEIQLGAVSWWTNQNGGGWMQELNMENCFAVNVSYYYQDYPQPSYQTIPVNFSTIETKAPYATLLFYAESDSPSNGWATVDIYVYMRN